MREYEGEKILVACNFYGEKTMASLKEIENIKTTVMLNNSDENKIVEDKIFLAPYGCIVVSLNK
ncbi:alpha-glucosidase C-terminal domain-containing protein [Clostridium sp. 1001275B_160808_H3]|uniref:alpha-glucosidase C-terminal domain-containing protein n=1 Tax=unclassified Clostridium TaxID=2614128 RepID=UPI00325F9D40